jgi:uncharacterized protein (TIGR02646 family)
VRHIVKRDPPASIVGYRNDTVTEFEDVRGKEKIRLALAIEQGYLCCYCLRRVEPVVGAIKIEHWASQRDTPERRFEWRNLLGSCMGGDGERLPRRDLTCDTRKEDQALSVNPTDASHVALVRFRGDGRVHSANAAIQVDLDRTLNLNHVSLVRARKATIDSVRNELARRHPGSWRRVTLEAELRRWRPGTSERRLPPFCEAVAQELERRLTRAP